MPMNVFYVSRMGNRTDMGTVDREDRRVKEKGIKLTEESNEKELYGNTFLRFSPEVSYTRPCSC